MHQQEILSIVLVLSGAEEYGRRPTAEEKGKAKVVEVDDAIIRAFLNPDEAGPSLSQNEYIQGGMAVGPSAAALHPLPAEPTSPFDSTFGTHSAIPVQESTSEEDVTGRLPFSALSSSFAVNVSWSVHCPGFTGYSVILLLCALALTESWSLACFGLVL